MFLNGNRTPKLAPQLGLVAAAMLLLMTLYEWLKQFFIPDISIWGSHFITIGFTTVLAVIISYFVLRQFHKEYRGRLEEIAKNEKNLAALRQSEEIWRGLVRNAKVGVYQVKPAGHFIMANSQMARIFGYEDATAFLKGVDNVDRLFVRPEERPGILERISANGFVDGVEVEFKTKDDVPFWALLSVRTYQIEEGKWINEGFLIDITERKRDEAEKDRLLAELEASMSQVKLLSGMLPICASCKKIRDDKGYWNRIEKYIESHSEAQFSHGCCPDCMKKLYPDII